MIKKFKTFFISFHFSRNIKFYFPALLFVHCSLFIVHCSYGQDEYTSKKFNLEVKQLDDFFKRFDTTDNDRRSTNMRSVAIYHLLNLEDRRLSSNDSVYKEFISYVVKNNIKLNFKDSNWYASVNCNITYKHKNIDIYLTLKINGDDYKGYKWVICGVDPKFLKSNDSYDSSKFISPDNNESDFMELQKVFEDYKNVENYICCESKIDYLSLFIYAVKNKELTFNHTNFIIYHLLQINNWILTVQDYNRDDYNSGWLISNIIKASNAQKQEYMKKIIFLK